MRHLINTICAAMKLFWAGRKAAKDKKVTGNELKELYSGFLTGFFETTGLKGMDLEFEEGKVEPIGNIMDAIADAAEDGRIEGRELLDILEVQFNSTIDMLALDDKTLIDLN